MYDVTVIGGGPAGLAAAISANQEEAKVLLIEREARLGGILKQCIHDGFGLLHFKERLTGTEYSERFIDELLKTNVDIKLLTYVVRVVKTDYGFCLHLVNCNGAFEIDTKTIVLATGCRERTSKQVFIHGNRPAGIFTAGTAQNFVNIEGQLPTRSCVILGSGDIGLIMARRLTLEGAKVLGVYEAKPTPSGLIRNIQQCLNDYDIPLYLSHTVTRVFGDDRLSAVEVAKVDNDMQPIKGTEKIIQCDSLILSVGLIPENELAESIDVKLNHKTKGPICDQTYITNIDGVYCAGNALHVSDMVDYVTENGFKAGKNSAHYVKKERKDVPLIIGSEFMYIIPAQLNLNADITNTTIYFRSSCDMHNAKLNLMIDDETAFDKQYSVLRPTEMERLEIDFGKYKLNENSKIEFTLADE